MSQVIFHDIMSAFNQSLLISENFTFITVLLKSWPTKISRQKRKVFVLVQEKNIKPTSAQLGF